MGTIRRQEYMYVALSKGGNILLATGLLLMLMTYKKKLTTSLQEEKTVGAANVFAAIAAIECKLKVPAFNCGRFADSHL